MWGFDNPKLSVLEVVDIDKIWEDYFDAIEAMSKNKLFSNSRHWIDKVLKFYRKKSVDGSHKKCLKTDKKSNMILELNPAGLRKPIEETYPSKALLEEAFTI